LSKELAEKIRKRREFPLVVGKWRLTLKRPTDVEMGAVWKEEVSDGEVARRFVVGWDGMTEDDVYGGGGTDAVPFTSECWSEVVADRLELWKPIVTAILEAYAKHRKDMEASEKN
jgi:hypothetical protein